MPQYSDEVWRPTGPPEYLTLDELRKRAPAQPDYLSLEELRKRAQPGGSEPGHAFVSMGPEASAAADAYRNPGGPDSLKKFIGAGVDIAREVAHTATFNYSDEAIAGVRAAFGEDMATALQQEREEILARHERLGAGGRILAGGLGVLLPGGPIARAVQWIAGRGAGLARQAFASGVVGVPVGTAAYHGAQDEKNLGEALIWGGGPGAVLGSAAPVLVRGAIAGANTLAVEPVRRIMEYIHSRGPNRYTPLPSTQRYAVERIVNAAEEGGTGSPIMLGRGLYAHEVPNTPSALVNAGNDRLNRLAAEQAERLRNPNVPRMVGGTPTQTNVFEALRQAQGTSADQAAAAARRMNEGLGIPPNLRSANTVQGVTQDAINRGSADIGALVARGGNTAVPGFRALLNASRDAERIYNDSLRALRVPGAPGHTVTPPLHGAQYRREFQVWVAGGRRGPRPVLLTDRNVPVAGLENMMAKASSMTRDDDAVVRDLGIQLHRQLNALTHAAPARSPAARLQMARQQLGITRTHLEDLQAGRQLPTATPGRQTEGLTEFERLPAGRQPSQRLGFVHGLNDQFARHREDLAGVTNLLANPQTEQLYERIARQGGAGGPTASALRRETANIADMQDVGQSLLRISQGRHSDETTALETLTKAYIKMRFQPGAGMAQLGKDWLMGNTQARRAQIARLLADTTGEGRRLVEAEMRRRGVNLNRLPPMLQHIAIQGLLQQVATQMGQM